MWRAGLLGAVVIGLDVVAAILGIWIAGAIWLWWRPSLTGLAAPPLPLWALYGPNPLQPPGLLLIAGWLGALRTEGLYDPGRMTRSIRFAAGISRAALMVVLGVVLLHFFLQAQTWSRALILLSAGAMSLFTLLFRLVFFRLQRRVARPLAVVKVAIVGDGEDAAQMDERIRRYGHASYQVVGFLRPGRPSPTPGVAPERVLGEVADFPRLVNAHDLRIVILTAFALEREEALELARRGDQMGLKVFQVPFTWGAASPRIDLANVGDLELIDLTVLSYPSAAEVWKRVMDLSLTLAGGLLLSPLLLLVALAVKLQDGGSVLYVQPRAGRGGRQFPFFKFRSMVAEAEALRPVLEAKNQAEGPLFKLADDPRVTGLGRWLRRWSVDELPQIWNVIRGDMNLVGPRPLPMRDLVGVEADPEIGYWFELRSKVKPGITGPWQVSGRSDLGFRDMVHLDIDYVQNWSLWLDLLILARTLPAVLRGRGAR